MTRNLKSGALKIVIEHEFFTLHVYGLKPIVIRLTIAIGRDGNMLMGGWMKEKVCVTCLMNVLSANLTGELHLRNR